MMKTRSFTFLLPQEILLGPGKGKETGKLVSPIGRKAFIVTGKHSARQNGILSEVCSSLTESGILYTVFDDVEPEPSLETVDRGLIKARDENIDMVISLGGGSALDSGKIIAGLLGNGESVRPFFDGATLPSPGKPWIAMPTTAGTGSEMTSNSVLTDYRRKLKKSVRSRFLVARMVIIDPLFTKSMNPFTTAVSGIDALVQAIEAYTSPHGNPVSDVLSLEAVKILWYHLPSAVDTGEQIEYREFVAKGSMMSAMAFANSSSGLAHGFSHIIGPAFSIAHGEACGMLLSHVIRYNAQVMVQKYSVLADALSLSGENEKEKVESFALAWEDVMRKVRLRTRLREFGVSEEMLAGVIREDNIGKNILDNPRPFSREGMVDFLKEVV
ncbi:MAG: iron-containing alcohol dehydrogenase [Candidatus Atribacteria bacterium]|nr:iron-containing alcohol dehydrogenase [Candidatus Atribacteria bacterium]